MKFDNYSIRLLEIQDLDCYFKLVENIITKQGIAADKNVSITDTGSPPIELKSSPLQ